MAIPDSNARQQRPIDEQVAKLIKEQKGSGMSVAAFARKHGVSPWKLYQAGRAGRRRRRKEFIEVTVSSRDPEAPPLEILVPGGLRVRVPPDFDEATLRRLLGALTSC